ncbi:MAG: hypothetical protein NTY35_11275 [Planctomycetota bacterium]|nr:hypothetical protein [Planctomycetota bacterium]
MTDWTFRRRQAECQACAKRFEEGERHASSLAIVGEALTREDVCVGCWLGRKGREELFHWFTRHREGKRGLQLDLGTLEALFVRLEGRLEPRVREMRYLLALLLLRKRRIKVDRILREAEGEAMLVHRPRRKESFRVYVFDFSPERMQALRADLVLLLEGAEPTQREGETASDAPRGGGGRDDGEREDAGGSDTGLRGGFDAPVALALGDGEHHGTGTTLRPGNS